MTHTSSSAGEDDDLSSAIAAMEEYEIRPNSRSSIMVATWLGHFTGRLDHDASHEQVVSATMMKRFHALPE